MNRQEIYNKVRDHLLAQKSRSWSGDECAYRGDDGKMCALGILIDDGVYGEDLEGNNVQCENVQRALKSSGISIESEDDVVFLEGLQFIHDERTPEYWKSFLGDFARRWNLEA